MGAESVRSLYKVGAYCLERVCIYGPCECKWILEAGSVLDA